MNDRPCAKCGAHIQIGEKYIQVANGVYVEDFETPTYDRRDPIESEFHWTCWDTAHPVAEYPYQCQFCGRRITRGALITYATVGHQPGSNYLRPSRRDPTILYLFDRECFADWAGMHVPTKTEI
jgi:hypothetical protein